MITKPEAIAEAVAERFNSDLRDERTAAWLGVALGVSFTVCFLTGLYSHLLQDEPSWLHFAARPAGLYRITQGVHLVTGFVSIPLLLAKLWAVYPHLLGWPPVRSIANALERIALVPLVGGGVFLLVSGGFDVARWYPWTFSFPRAHFWAAWITIGALVVHIGAKATVTTRALRPGASRPATSPAVVADRRAFLAGVTATSVGVAVVVAGGTVSAVGALGVLSQRQPGDGPQGVPVNKSAAGAGVVDTARSPGYRLVVEGAVANRLMLTLDDLLSLRHRDATLPIACVEGWSASARWSGVPVRDLLDLAGAAPGASATVESLQVHGSYRASVLNSHQASDPDTLLATRLRGEPLDIDHGYPVRLIGPNRPGVLQTKWVTKIVVQ